MANHTFTSRWFRSFQLFCIRFLLIGAMPTDQLWRRQQQPGTLPCLEQEFCQRVFGERPEDVAEFGNIPPCPFQGWVRCIDPADLRNPNALLSPMPILDNALFHRTSNSVFPKNSPRADQQQQRFAQHQSGPARQSTPLQHVIKQVQQFSTAQQQQQQPIEAPRQQQQQPPFPHSSQEIRQASPESNKQSFPPIQRMTDSLTRSQQRPVPQPGMPHRQETFRDIPMLKSPMQKQQFPPLPLTGNASPGSDLQSNLVRHNAEPPQKRNSNLQHSASPLPVNQASFVSAPQDSIWQSTSSPEQHLQINQRTVMASPHVSIQRQTVPSFQEPFQINRRSFGQADSFTPHQQNVDLIPTVPRPVEVSRARQQSVESLRSSQQPLVPPLRNTPSHPGPPPSAAVSPSTTEMDQTTMQQIMALLRLLASQSNTDVNQFFESTTPFAILTPIVPLPLETSP